MMQTGMEAAAASACGEELEPLFDYSRVQPNIAFSFDDTDLEKSDIFVHCNKRRKAAVADAGANANANAGEGDKADEKVVKKPAVVDLAEEDWLPPPPPKPAVRAEVQNDSTLQELRLQKQEMTKLAESARSVMEKFELETAKKDLEAKKPPEHIVLDDSPEQQAVKEREKLVITIQDKDGQQQFRIYKDDKLDKLFKAFARKVKLNLSDLTFVFDGDKIDPTSTPDDLGLENDDMIEACYKLH